MKKQRIHEPSMIGKKLASMFALNELFESQISADYVFCSSKNKRIWFRRNRGSSLDTLDLIKSQVQT